ncbi:unnamed protein product [Hanseniaspora opuntiae]
MTELAAQLGIDPTLKKKKKKTIKLDDLDAIVSSNKESQEHSSSSAPATDDITAALEKAGIDESLINEQLQASPEPSSSAAADKPESRSYDELLSRFFNILKQNNPELAGEKSSTKFRIPPPVCQRDGKKTIFVNIEEICEKLQRSTDHLIQYLYAELGTSGSIDGQKRLIIKGKFVGKQMENVLRRYILEYVTCKTCKSINTELKKEQSNRLFFLVCKSCGSTRSVSTIKSGFQATVKRVKKF